MDLRLTFKILFITLLLGCLNGSPLAFAQELDHSFIILTSDTVRQLPPFSDKDFYAKSTGVIFKSGKSDINPDDPFFSMYRNEIVPHINDGHLQLRKIFIRGAASPEGAYAINQRLGKGRSQALLTELLKELRYQYIKPEVDVSSVTEDYGYLCLLMDEAHDPDLDTVKAIYEQSNGDEQSCKQRLMSVQGGKLWQRLVQQYFPQLRSARFMLWLSEPDAEHAPVVVSTRDTIYVRDTLVVVKQTVVDNVTVAVPPLDTDTIFRHPLLAIKTNLLFDALTMLNLEVEYPFRNRYSVAAEVVWPWWLDRSHNKWCLEMGSVGVEGRYWFRPWEQCSTYSRWRREEHAPLQGWFVGAYLNGGYYDFQFRKRNGSQGEFLGAGISGGYSRMVGNNWRVEFSLGVGADFYRDRKYYIEDNTPTDPEREQHLWKDGAERKSTWIGPTKLKISLSYLLFRKCKKGGKS